MSRFGVAAVWIVLLSGYIVEARAQYKCTTKDGKVVYSDKPCAESVGSGVSQREIAPPAPSAGSNPSKGAASPNAGLGQSGQGFPGASLPLFKKAIDEGDSSGARLVQHLAKGQDAQAMQQYAETECRKGNKTACLTVYCGDKTSDQKDYFSPKCADITGRAYGTNWMEVDAGRPTGRGTYEHRIACLPPDPNSYSSYNYAGLRVEVECQSLHKSCRHNQAPDRGGRTATTAFSNYLSSLGEAGETACKLALERMRRARGK